MINNCWLYYGSEGAGVLTELEAVFVIKDVCITEYYYMKAIIIIIIIISASIKD